MNQKTKRLAAQIIFVVLVVAIWEIVAYTLQKQTMPIYFLLLKLFLKG